MQQRSNNSIMNIHKYFKNSIHKNALLFIGLFCILGLVYLKVPVHNVITINPRFIPDMHIYHKSSDMDSSDAEGKLPNVKFAGTNVRNMYAFLILWLIFVHSRQCIYLRS